MPEIDGRRTDACRTERKTDPHRPGRRPGCPRSARPPVRRTGAHSLLDAALTEAGALAAGRRVRAGSAVDLRAEPGLAAEPAAESGYAEIDMVGNRPGRTHSWVLGWAHRLDPQDPRTLYPMDEDGGLAVRRIAEAVVEVLLEHRSAEQVRRWVSRDVFRSLSSPAETGRARRFAARSMLRSLRLHHPAAGAVESTVLIQEGERVRAVALRFDRCALPSAAARLPESGRPDWLCTAIQFG
ncbi:MAG TPA: Rv3235 family protein [Actinocrinis sp.]|nr:Rv3235 family protein [Actinocrinis sp.]